MEPWATIHAIMEAWQNYLWFKPILGTSLARLLVIIVPLTLSVGVALFVVVWWAAQ